MMPAEELADAMQVAAPGVFPQYRHHVGPLPRTTMLALLTTAMGLLGAAQPLQYGWIVSRLTTDDLDALAHGIAPLLRLLGHELGYEQPTPKGTPP